MKKNLASKELVCIMAATMAAGLLAGCGSGAGSETAATSSAAATSAAAAATSAPAAAATSEAAAAATSAAASASGSGVDSFVPFADKVTLQIPVYDRGKEGIPQVDDNYWTKWVQSQFGDKYNITVKYVPITRSDVMTDYANLAAASNLPTMLMEYDYPKLAQWANDGYLATVDMDQFKTVAPTYYQSMEDNNVLPYSSMNGENYFVMGKSMYYDTVPTWQVFVRMDWLRKIGYDHVPVTRAEQVDAFKKMQDQGICKHPLASYESMVTGLGADQNYNFREFPEDEENWAKYSSIMVYALGEDWDKALLKRENENYNLGFLDPEYYINDADAANAKFINGEGYCWGGYISNTMPVLSSFYEANPDAELAIQPWPTEDDTEGGTTRGFRSNSPFGMIVGFSSQATPDEVKAAEMFLEWLSQPDNLFTMQWGIEGQNFNYDDSKTPVTVADYTGESQMGYNNNQDYWSFITNLRSLGSAEKDLVSQLPTGLPDDFSQEVLDYYNARLDASKAGLSIVDPIYTVAIDAETENSGSLLELYKEYRNKIVMAKTADFESTYKELSQQYLDAGYQSIVDERDQAYKDGNCSKLADNQKK
ncbi:MAG: extracellular solute-binding protein [Lachnospiraceae bacterium]|jgi:putative aldouronate transport system substrate-binding protein|nr:extracellular solute-binding protein [Lachnospiraceae bacterium]